VNLVHQAAQRHRGLALAKPGGGGGQVGQHLKLLVQ
jgi:hypothetical protein